MPDDKLHNHDIEPLRLTVRQWLYLADVFNEITDSVNRLILSEVATPVDKEIEQIVDAVCLAKGRIVEGLDNQSFDLSKTLNEEFFRVKFTAKPN